MRHSRRTLAGLLTGLVSLAAFGAVAGLFTQFGPWWAYPFWVTSAVLSGLLASTYADSDGLSAGCPGCTRLAIVAIPAALFIQAGHGGFTTDLLSVFLLGSGLVQRLATGARCAVPLVRARPTDATTDETAPVMESSATGEHRLQRRSGDHSPALAGRSSTTSESRSATDV